MVLKASFLTLQGHSFVWIYFPFPTLSLATSEALQSAQTSRRDEASRDHAKFLPWPCSPKTCKPFPPPRRGASTALRSRTWYTRQMAFGDSHSSGSSPFILPTLWQTAEYFVTYHLFSLFNTETLTLRLIPGRAFQMNKHFWKSMSSKIISKSFTVSHWIRKITRRSVSVF